MVGFLLDRPVEPVHQLLHPAGRFKRRRRFEHHSQTLAVRPEGLDIIAYLLVFAAMVLVLGGVLQQHAVQLLDVVLRGGDG